MFSLCGNCYLTGHCVRLDALIPSVATVRQREVRLECQNFLVDLAMPYRRLIDFLIDQLRDFPGRWVDENCEQAQAPGIACVLNDGAEFWLRDQIENGKWNSIADVPDLRYPAIGRWRLIGTVKNISEAAYPLCIRC